MKPSANPCVNGRYGCKTVVVVVVWSYPLIHRGFVRNHLLLPNMFSLPLLWCRISVALRIYFVYFRMSRLDVKNYLQKIYQISVANVNIKIQEGK